MWEEPLQSIFSNEMLILQAQTSGFLFIIFANFLLVLQLDYCNEVTRKLKESGIRAEVCSGERLPKLIRNSEKQKIPLMAVVGPNEVETQTVTVRSRFGGELGTMKIDDFVSRTKFAAESRTFI